MKKSLYFILCFACLNVLHAMDEEIIVTSSLGGVTLAEIDSPVFVISGEKINNSASTSLGENLNHLLGVNSISFGSAVGQPSIRGMTGTRVRILSNGKVVRDVSGLGTDHLNDVDMNDIQQIEVVRGPSSLLYANGTMGGIINLVDQTIASKDFDGNIFNIGLEAQSVNKGTSGSFSYKGNINDVNLTYALKDINFESYDVPLGAIIHDGSPEAEDHLENSDYSNFSHKFGTSIVRDWGYFGFSVGDIENTYGIAFHGEHHDEEEEEEEDHEEHEERIEVNTDSSNLTIEGAALNLSGLAKLSYFAQVNDYEFIEGHIGGEHDGESTTFNNESFDIGLKFDIGNQNSGNRQNVTLNLSQEEIAILPSDENDDPFMRPSESGILSIGYFICRELDVMDLDFGVRLDQVNRDGSIKVGNTTTLYDISESDISSALTMGWDPIENLELTLGISSVARAPSELELFMNGAHLAAGRNEYGNPNLESERSNNLDFNIKYEKEGYFLNTSLYTNSVDNYIYLLGDGTETDELPNTSYTQADANFNGYEIEVGKSFILNNREIQISYGRDQVIGTFSDGGNVPRITPVKNIYRLSILQDRVAFDLTIKDVQREDDLSVDETTITEGFTMVDFDLRRSFGSDEELVVTIFGKNLLDEKARDHASYVKDEVPLPGKNFGIKLNFNF